MSQDIPAEFLPALPSSRQRSSLTVRDARVEAMMAHMQQRPSSVRRESVESQRSQSQRQSVDRSSRVMSIDRPMSMRSAASDRPRLELTTPAIVSAVVVEERPQSMRSNGGFGRDPSGSIDSVRSGASGRSRAPEDLPVVMAQIERDDVPPTPPPKPANHPFIRSFENTAGNRDTLTLSDEELARRLHEQLNNIHHADGQIVTAEIVQQEVMDRRQAEELLDQEIAFLENAVMARQLEGPDLLNDAGQAEDDAFRAALAMNDKLDYMRPESHKPIFSAIIFGITALAMGVEVALNGGVEPFSVNPTFGPKPEILLIMGAKRSDLILAGEWWRLIAPIILHAGFLHLVFNMLGLWNIGVPMEREFGSWKISAIYILSGLFGVLMSCLFAPTLTSVGASGAIFGLFGAAWADLIQNWGLYKGAQCRMFAQLFLMTAFNVILGLMPFLDNYAHLGGMICGCILGLGVLVQTRYYYSGVKKGKRTYQIVLMVISLLLLPGIFIAGYLVLFLRVPIDCDWCTYISCVPMPPGVPIEERWWSCDECSQGGLSGDIDPLTNTLSFDCPNNGVRVEKEFPNSTTITSGILIETCLDLCLN